MSDLDKFLEERSNILIPSGDLARIELLARELALGVHRRVWTRYLDIGNRAKSRNQNLQTYIERRWGYNDFEYAIELLLGHGFVHKGKYDFILSESSFGVIDDILPANTFISYRRLDSSALALLVLARLKEHGFEPFLDMALEAGGNWHADLEERIKACDYFIILLGNDTLKSDMTIKELLWASENQRTIIPIWHYQFGLVEGFELSDKVYECAENWEDKFVLGKQDRVIEIIQQTNAIRVTDESASGYNSVIVELLNRFGVTP